MQVHIQVLWNINQIRCAPNSFLSRFPQISKQFIEKCSFYTVTDDMTIRESDLVIKKNVTCEYYYFTTATFHANYIACSHLADFFKIILYCFSWVPKSFIFAPWKPMWQDMNWHLRQNQNSFSYLYFGVKFDTSITSLSKELDDTLTVVENERNLS